MKQIHQNKDETVRCSFLIHTCEDMYVFSIIIMDKNKWKYILVCIYLFYPSIVCQILSTTLLKSGNITFNTGYTSCYTLTLKTSTRNFYKTKCFVGLIVWIYITVFCITFKHLSFNFQINCGYLWKHISGTKRDHVRFSHVLYTDIFFVCTAVWFRRNTAALVCQ